MTVKISFYTVKVSYVILVFRLKLVKVIKKW